MINQIKEKINNSRRSGDTKGLLCYQSVLSKCQAIGKFDDETVLSAIKKEIKELKEEHGDKTYEIGLLEVFLPRKINPDEFIDILGKITDNYKPSDFSNVMKEARKYNMDMKLFSDFLRNISTV